MTRPVLNLTAPIAEVKGDGKAYLLPPWNSFFQQFVQQAPAIQNVTSGGSPFQPNPNGTVIVQGAATTTLTRGVVAISLGAGQNIIPVSIGDIVSWTGAATVRFLGA